MKKKLSIALGSLVLVAAVSFSLFLVKSQPVTAKYANKTENQVIEELSRLGKDELLSECKAAASETTRQVAKADFSYFAIVMSMREDEFSAEEIVSLAKDSRNDSLFRCAMVQMYEDKEATAECDTQLKQMLSDASVDSVIKRNIVLSVDFSTAQDVQLLTDIARGEDDLLAFQSIKKLKLTNPEVAKSLSKSILSNLENESTEKIKAAIKAEASYFYNQKFKADAAGSGKVRISAKAMEPAFVQDKAAFIELCMEVFEETDDALLKDSCIYALSDMVDPEAILAVLRSDADNDIKRFCINQNYLTLIEVLENSPTEEEIQLVCKAMQIHAITDLLEPLQAIEGIITSDEVTADYREAISLIRSEGVEGFYKWAWYYEGGHADV